MERYLSVYVRSIQMVKNDGNGFLGRDYFYTVYYRMRFKLTTSG